MQAIGVARASEERIAAEPEKAGASVADSQRLRGAILVNVAKLRAVASGVYNLSSRSIAGAGDRNSWAREWKHLEADLLALANASSADEQGRIAARVHRTYLVFRT